MCFSIVGVDRCRSSGSSTLIFSVCSTRLGIQLRLVTSARRSILDNPAELPLSFLNLNHHRLQQSIDIIIHLTSNAHNKAI